jgi:predicted metal-dependent hydrolase
VQKIDFTIKKSKGRILRISINRKAEVFLHVPRYVPLFVAKKFLLSKQDWILNNLEKVKKSTPTTTSHSTYLKNKEEARKLVLEKLDFWKNFYKDNFDITFSWKNVSIKNTTTRWGSCSAKKNLNFSYKIISLSPSAQDYLIVHELCHLIQMNHSKNFWELVTLGCPDWKKRRYELKGNNI